MARFERLDAAKAALVIIDMQGRLAEIVHESDSVINDTVIMIKGAGLFELPVYCLEQLPEKLGRTTERVAEAMPDVEPVAKQTFSGLQAPDFARQLQSGGRSQILLAGIESHVCVFQTGRDLLAAGYTVFPLTDCISSRRLSNRQLGLSQLEQAGANLTSVEMALFELQGEAAGPRFQKMIQLLR